MASQEDSFPASKPSSPPHRQLRTAARTDSQVPRKLRRYLCLDDFENVARQRLPRQIYGYYSGAAESGAAMSYNRDSYRKLGLVPRVLVDTRKRSTAVSLFGSNYSMPVGIPPMGLAGLSTLNGDLVLAKAAVEEKVPMVVSGASLMALERLANEGGARWFQAYLPGDADRIDAMVTRVAAASYETLVLTVDLPASANRENNERNGFSMPLKPSFRLMMDGLTHPRWSVGTFLATLLTAMPHFENMDAFRGPAILSSNVVRDVGARDGLNWSHVAQIRRLWPGNFVLKGILSPNDVALARDSGVDGIWLSNHGGRQLDSAIAPLTVLQQATKQAGDMTIIIDGGIRRGTDVLKALALGADFVFIGRPFLYAAASAGVAGVRHALRLLQAEIFRDMAMLGINALSEATTEHVREIRN